jgi:hypothetical protein
MEDVHRERLRQWCEALESGEYIQGCRALNPIEGRFCALGVLCDLFIKSPENVTGWHWETVLTHMSMTRGENHAAWYRFPPGAVSEWVGVELASMKLPHKRFMAKVDFINDEGVPFKELARRIRHVYYLGAA